MPVAPSKPPGRRLIKRMSTRTKWLLLAPFSLILIGYGLCVFSEAANLKHTGEPFSRWFLLGTYSLIVINAGLSLFGQAIIFRVQMETRRAIRRHLKKLLRARQKKENPVRRA
ncbi:hypothetical protein GCM10028803_23260 [Larkinella knui]|uniref:Uncharacterized protein n=1 Tax=Larkinella knui TaxID=2025310 RepID=A0A3P1CVJ1_9BACT|nr:hypothetical protein [Larkinella knui]RRB17397.1 hypothetical protein EHT87_03675 [Larkinella knui]